MPLFDFVCRACGKEFETLVMGKEKPACPDCQSVDLQKKMSTFAHRTGGKGGVVSGASPAGSSCSGCAGGTCATCH